MDEDLLDESLFDENFNSNTECDCKCGCTVPVHGRCIDCAKDNGHQNLNGLPEYDHINELTLKRIGEY